MSEDLFDILYELRNIYDSLELIAWLIFKCRNKEVQTGYGYEVPCYRWLHFGNNHRR